MMAPHAGHNGYCMRVFYDDDSKACTCGVLNPKPRPLEYSYVAGGWFREKGVPAGDVGKVLHGNQVIAFYRGYR